ncbi:MAG: TRAP transporter permease [Proteobacteria bacterium]|nr:TRAP transporter permease [Pseudomonadota bacterium]
MNLIAPYVVRLVAVGLSTFHIYTAYFGTFYPYVQRSVPVMLALILTFLTVRASAKDRTSDAPVPLYDWGLALLAVPVIGYITFNSDYLANRWPMTPSFPVTDLQITFGVLASLLILEATRRLLGWPLVIVAVIALLYTYYGEYSPFLVLQHRAYTFAHMLDYIYLTDNGIWGVALGVAATYIVLFIIFGAFAEKAGVSEFFIDIANSIAGHTRGGPAKVAIFSSGMIGSVTGSTVANVYTTGQFTIPMMKRLGYRPAVAGAVEALASNGGQIMPPILGATAFILAAYSGVPYIKVAIASLIPALLYFGGLLWFIHLEASKTGLAGIPKSEKPDFLKVLLKGGHLMSPLAVLIGCLVYGFSPVRAAFFAIVFTVIISWVRKETRLGPREIVEALEAGAKSAVLIVVTCAAVGFVIGGFLITGLGLNVSSAIISMSGGYFLGTLFLVGLACMVLGMGMNTVAAFILVSVAGVPALTAQGVDPLVANMFVFYFALLSHITPPVCLAIFAGAQIANANVWETAFVGMKMSAVPYLLPFLIVFTPSLLLFGTAEVIALNTLAVAIGFAFIISGVQGWALYKAGLVERLLYFLVGGCFIWPTMEVKAAALVLGAVAVTYVVLRNKRVTAESS